jgi:hypothetical protein
MLPKATCSVFLAFLLTFAVFVLGPAGLMEGPEGFWREIRAVLDDVSRLFAAGKMWLVRLGAWGLLCSAVFERLFILWGMGMVALTLTCKGFEHFVLSCHHVQDCHCFDKFHSDPQGEGSEKQCGRCSSPTFWAGLTEAIVEIYRRISDQAQELRNAQAAIKLLGKRARICRHYHEAPPPQVPTGQAPEPQASPSADWVFKYNAVCHENSQLREEIEKLRQTPLQYPGRLFAGSASPGAGWDSLLHGENRALREKLARQSAQLDQQPAAAAENAALKGEVQWLQDDMAANQKQFTEHLENTQTQFMDEAAKERQAMNEMAAELALVKGMELEKDVELEIAKYEMEQLRLLVDGQRDAKQDEFQLNENDEMVYTSLLLG